MQDVAEESRDRVTAASVLAACRIRISHESTVRLALAAWCSPSSASKRVMSFGGQDERHIDDAAECYQTGVSSFRLLQLADKGHRPQHTPPVNQFPAFDWAAAAAQDEVKRLVGQAGEPVLAGGRASAASAVPWERRLTAHQARNQGPRRGYWRPHRPGRGPEWLQNGLYGPLTGRNGHPGGTGPPRDCGGLAGPAGGCAATR
jgi:hypothetical protein